MNHSMPGIMSITSSQSPPKLMSIESVMPSNCLILCRPLLLLPSIFPSIRVFSHWVGSSHQVAKVLELPLQGYTNAYSKDICVCIYNILLAWAYTTVIQLYIWIQTACCLLTNLCPALLLLHGLEPVRVLCPCDFPVKNTGVGCHFLFQ